MHPRRRPRRVIPHRTFIATLGVAALLAGLPISAAGTPHDARIGQVAPGLTRTTAAAPKPASAVFAARSTAAPRPLTGSRGRRWDARTVGWGTWNRSDGLVGKPIAGTRDDAIYRSNAWGIKWYRLDVPAAATYSVRLHMAEDFFTAPGRRVFDVRAEGRVVARGVENPPCGRSGGCARGELSGDGA